VGPASVGLTEAAVGLALGAWLLRLAAYRGFRSRRLRLALPALAFASVGLLSLQGALSLETGVAELIKWIEFLGLYVMVATEVDARWLRVVLVALLGTGAFAALQGIYQFLFRVGPEGFVLFERFMRAYGTFDQPNPFGGYLGLTLPLAIGLGLAFLFRGRGAVGWRWMALAVCCGALMLAALTMSWSRGAWMGFAAAVVAMALAAAARGGRPVVAVVLVAACVVALLVTSGVALVPTSVTQRLAGLTPYVGISDVTGAEVTDANYATLERIAHWQAALGMWADHPWLGVGLGNYASLYSKYRLPNWPDPLGHAHNYYLNIAAETGLVGLLAYLVLWGAALVGAWRAARVARGLEWGVAVGVFGAVTHLWVHNAVDNLFVHGMYLHLAIVLGLIPVLLASVAKKEPMHVGS
jgi:putative inorganic carbon (HCO3(-)) transporter